MAMRPFCAVRRFRKLERALLQLAPRVLLVGDLLEPHGFGRIAAAQRYLPELAVRRGAVPVLDIRRRVVTLAYAKLAQSSAAFLDAGAATLDEQQLTPGMPMPRTARAGSNQRCDTRQPSASSERLAPVKRSASSRAFCACTIQ